MSKAFESAVAPRFSRQWWCESAKTGFWVVVVTILIWIYADMEFTRTREVTLVIRLNTKGSSDTVLVSKPTKKITYELRGSGTNLDRFAKKYRGSELHFDLSTLPDFSTETMKAVPSVSVLEAMPEVRQSGLKVVSGNPVTISGIKLEKLEARKLEVEFIFKGAELADGFQPKATVEGEAPPSHWADIPPGAKIRTVEKNLSDLPVGEEQDVKFRLITAIGAHVVRIKDNTDRTVTVRVKIERRVAPATATIKINVRISTPAKWAEGDMWNQFKLEKKDSFEWSPRIKVTGPRKHIEKLKGRTKDIHAYIILKESDKEPRVTSTTADVIIQFPPKLDIQLAPGQAVPTVRFRLVPRN